MRKKKTEKILKLSLHKIQKIKSWVKCFCRFWLVYLNFLNFFYKIPGVRKIICFSGVLQGPEKIISKISRSFPGVLSNTLIYEVLQVDSRRMARSVWRRWLWWSLRMGFLSSFRIYPPYFPAKRINKHNLL